ncbi:hypothetical protein PRJ_4591 [Pseudomonas sp. XWY-1]|nr:hypothetical protein PRJ_4591 [Pseudomonas sp. XWY-1]
MEIGARRFAGKPAPTGITSVLSIGLWLLARTCAFLAPVDVTRSWAQ